LIYRNRRRSGYHPIFSQCDNLALDLQSPQPQFPGDRTGLATFMAGPVFVSRTLKTAFPQPRSAESCEMPIIPGQDPNEAYEIDHMPAREHDLPPDWWTVFCNGIPVRHCAPDRHDLAERYANPDYRLSLIRTKWHDR
jgi:hypothetical protein